MNATTKSSSKFPRGHIDFALQWEEIKCCVVCGEMPRDGWWYSDLRVTPAGPHPIGGCVGICAMTLS